MGHYLTGDVGMARAAPLLVGAHGENLARHSIPDGCAPKCQLMRCSLEAAARRRVPYREHGELQEPFAVEIAAIRLLLTSRSPRPGDPRTESKPLAVRCDMPGAW